MATQEQDLLARMARLDSLIAEEGLGGDEAAMMSRLDSLMTEDVEGQRAALQAQDEGRARRAEAEATVEELPESVLSRPTVPELFRPQAPDLRPRPAAGTPVLSVERGDGPPPSARAQRLIDAQNIRMGRTPPLASLETPEQREAAADVITRRGESRTTPGQEARAEISEQDRLMARFQALGELPEQEGLDVGDIPGAGVVLGGLASAGDVGAQPFRALGRALGRETGRLSAESMDRFSDRRAEERAVREESTGVMNRLRRAGTFGVRVGAEVAMIEAALAAAVPALATGAIVAGAPTVGRAILRVGAREAAVGGASEFGVGLAETGDVREASVRGAFGAGAGGLLGGAFGGVARRSLTRSAARALAEGSQEAAEEVTEHVVRRLGPGPANAPPPPGNRVDPLRRVDFREAQPELRPDRLLPRAGETTPSSALRPEQVLPEIGGPGSIEAALRAQVEGGPRRITARSGGPGRAAAERAGEAGGRGTGGQVTPPLGPETALEQAARISRSASDASPRGATGAAAEAIQRAEAEAALPRQMTPEEALVAEEIRRTGRVPDELPLRQDKALRPGARVPGPEEAAPFPARRPDPTGEVLQSERAVTRGIERRARDLAFEGAERRAGGDRRNLPGARVGGELSELRRIAAEADAAAREADINRVIGEGPDASRGGFVVNPKRDLLESAVPKGASPELREVLGRVSVGAKPKRKIPSWNDFMTNVVDRTHGIKAAGRALAEGVDLARMDLVDIAARLSSGAARRAESFLRSGGGRWTPDGNWERTGTRGLTPILADMRGNLQALRGYLLSARTLEVGARGVKQSVDDATGRAVVRQTDEAVREAGQEITNLLDDALAYYADAAGIPVEELMAMRAAGRFYIPLDKVFEGIEGVAIKGKGGGGPIQKLGDSERDFIDPLESTVDYIKRMIRAGDDQRILRNLGELVERNPEKALELGIQEVPLKYTSRADAAAESLIRAMDREGVTITMQQALDTVDPLLVRSSEVGDTFTAWVGGQRRTYRIPPNVAKAFLSMNPSQAGILRRFLINPPARFLRAGVTLNPIFQVVNGWRDMLTATVQSQYGFTPFDMGRGFWESAKANWFGAASKQYDEFVAGGGGFSGLSRGQDRISNQRALQNIIRGGEPTNPVTLLKKFAVPWEEAARIGEFMKARGKGAGLADAILASQDVTVNFQQMGASMAAMSQMTAFMNAGIQSMDVMARTVGRAAKNPAPFVLWGAGGMAMPSAMLWFANRDDQDIQDLRKTAQGSIYWFVRDPMDSEGAIFRIPKPFVWGQIFGTLTESVMDSVADQDPAAMARFGEALLGQAMFAFIPNAGQIPVEQWANKDLFFNSDLVPAHLDRFEPRMQVNERTSRMAKTIAALGGAVRENVPGADLVPGGEFFESPIRVDAMLRDLGGTLTSESLRLVDHTLDSMLKGQTVEKPAPGRGEMAFFNRFVARNPSLGSEPVQTFWEGAIPAQEAVDSYRELTSTGQDAAAQDLYRRRGPELLAATVYTSVRSQVSDIRGSIEEIRAAPSNLFAPDTDVRARKRELIDRYTQQYVELTRSANRAVAQITAAAEEQAANRSDPGG